MRELREETGCEGEIVGLVDVVDGLIGDRHYVLIDYAVRWTSGEPKAGDDAREARFVTAAELPVRLSCNTFQLAVNPLALMSRVSGRKEPSKLGLSQVDCSVTVVSFPSGRKLSEVLPLRLMSNSKLYPA